MNNQIFNHNGTEITPEAFHPGIYLLEEIEQRELLKKDVAKALDLLPNNLSQIFNGKRNISAQLAIKLEKYLGVSAEYWYGLQNAYDLHEARHHQLEEQD